MLFLILWGEESVPEGHFKITFCTLDSLPLWVHGLCSLARAQSGAPVTAVSFRFAPS